MPNGESSLLDSLVRLWPVGLLAGLGATFDYWYSVKKGKRSWSVFGYLIHLGFAVFVGYLAALLVVGLGYSVEVAGAVAGGAGWANTKLIDLFMIWFRGKYGNGNGCNVSEQAGLHDGELP